MNRHRLFLSAATVLLACALSARAQWITQTNSLKAGWNAVYLHVDATHATLDEMISPDVSNPIQEIWMWVPSSPGGQFVNSPATPSGLGNQWASWVRMTGPSSVLQRLAGNAAYLVKVATNTVGYTWLVKGRPVAPNNLWSLTGLNFVGFQTPPTVPPTFESFLAPAPVLQANAEIYRYQGGELTTTNPVRVFAFRTTPVKRDQAYWVRAGENYNDYFGPFQVAVSPTGIRFGDSKGQATLRLRNLTGNPLTVALRSVPSENAPAGLPTVQGPAPLLVRGPLNTTNLTFTFQTLASGPLQWALAPSGQPGSEVEIVLGLNRAQMGGNPGATFANVLRFTDSLALSQIDVPVSAEAASTIGLWVGGATVSYVSQYLKNYAKATNSGDFSNVLARLQLAEGTNGYHYEWDVTTGRILVFGGPQTNTGSYLLDGPIKVDSGSVPRAYPLRLIVHNDGTTARLLQRAYYGLGTASNMVVAAREGSLLASDLQHSRRVSAVHLPFSDGNTPWSFSGSMSLGQSITATVNTSYDDQSSNPFLHTYHPDHDNLDALFTTQLPEGMESYGLSRQITLSFTAPANDFDSLTRGSQDLKGNYSEAVTFRARNNFTRQYNALGTFVLKRVTDIATLTQ